MSLTLSEIRHRLVIAAQAEYDRRIQNGANPHSFASYHFDRCITNELKKHIDTSKWKAGNWKELNEAFDDELYNSRYSHWVSNENVDYGNGQWAVGAFLNSAEAWSTPGFAEAYSYNSNHGG